MSNQVEINFEVHAIENLPENQEILDSNKVHFTKQCKIVYEALKRGERLTTSIALIKYGIGDLRRRIKDLKDDNQIPVQSEKIKGRFKEWFLETDNTI